MKILLILLSILLLSCSAQKKREILKKKFKARQDCMEKWEYKELSIVMNVKVLVFIPAHRLHILYYANFAFCQDSIKDTIGIIIDNHKYLTTKIIDGMTISIAPPTWNNYKDENEIVSPPSMNFNDKKKRNLYCATKTVYYVSLK